MNFLFSLGRAHACNEEKVKPSLQMVGYATHQKLDFNLESTDSLSWKTTQKTTRFQMNHIVWLV